jgi:signal transduction histidine kinase
MIGPGASPMSSIWKKHLTTSGKGYPIIELLFRGTDMKVEMTYDLIDIKLTPEVKTTVLLVIKEAVTNVVKHAKATRLTSWYTRS